MQVAPQHICSLLKAGNERTSILSKIRLSTFPTRGYGKMHTGHITEQKVLSPGLVGRVPPFSDPSLCYPSFALPKAHTYGLGSSNFSSPVLSTLGSLPVDPNFLQPLPSKLGFSLVDLLHFLGVSHHAK